MPTPGLRCAFIVLLAAIIEATAAEAAQRRPPRPDNSSNGLQALGLWQPESVRAILLLYSGKSLSKNKAQELEGAVKKAPEKIDERLLLIGYYTANANSRLEREALRAHVLWMIENHPEHPATGEPSLRDLAEDPQGNAQILSLWEKNLETRSGDLDVLRNAEKFFFGKDPAKADLLIHQLAEKEPNNAEWPHELAQLYRMFGIPGDATTDPAARASEEYARVLALTRAPAARRALAGDMAEAAFKTGDFDGAAVLAKIYLQGNDRMAPQRANTVLGRVALRSGNIGQARQYLLASCRQDAGPDIALSGPTMILAKELLDEGEKQAVIEYLDQCLPLWPRGENILRMWMKEIENGKAPNFGNLGF